MSVLFQFYCSAIKTKSIKSVEFATTSFQFYCSAIKTVDNDEKTVIEIDISILL